MTLRRLLPDGSGICCADRLRDERMVEFRDYRIPTEAPITKQAANQQFR